MRRQDMAEEEVPLNGSTPQQEVESWDIFEDPPKSSNTGSTAESKWLEGPIKIFKVFTVFVVFCVVLGSAVVSKSTLLLMTSQIKKNTTRAYCNEDLDTRQQFIVSLPSVERVVWMWLLIFTYWIPELGTFIRSVRMSFFKTWQRPGIWEFLALFFTESLPTIGSAILVFIVLPELDVIKGAMLTNAVCFVPAVVGLFSRKPNTVKHSTELILDIVCIVAQASSFVVWPLVENRPVLYFIPVAVILISIGWWENYVSEESPIPFVSFLGKIHSKFQNRRYFMYVFISLWKCLLFFACAMFILIIREGDANFMFDQFVDSFSSHRINITEIEPIIGGSSIDFSDAMTTGLGSYTTTSYWTPIVVWLVNIATTYICYAFGKFSCKVMIQGFGLAFPINMTVPVLLSLLIAMSGTFNKDECAYSNSIPKYLFFNTPPLYFLNDFISQQHSWIWLVWLLSQAWITVHIWTSNANSDKLMSTEQLFVKPLYDAFLIDQSIAMNRRRRTTERVIKDDAKKMDDDETRIFACGTMWHESKEEMMEFVKSIMRLDEDQCAHRLVRTYFKTKRPDYYDLETHIFFDDAFIRVDEKDQDPHVNSYVMDLIDSMDEAASKVHGVNILVRPPKIYPTPYGGQLVWTLPGKTKMIAHLKDKAKIRAKKRWSQVMYMYYLLGYKLMANDSLDPQSIETISENTYLLALDGDIDFQPNAVKLLVDYMKRNKTLGAACGRIHPIGSGAMAWYQMFEYAIGHWLQKATEHVIGCVLCSPGCFSLFRGKALMDDSVMRKYTTVSEEPLHYVQYDQGEDRWLCTLLLQKGYRVEYSAASDAYTHCPEGFNEFYNQRRRWMPSTIANIFDLLGDYKRTVKINDNISTLYIGYQMIIMIGTVIGPGTIFLMLVGAFVAAFKMDQWSSFIWNMVPILFFVIICATCKANTQLFFAGIISAIYGLIMMAVFVGVMLQISDDGFLAPSSLFFFVMAGEMIVAAMLHPKEFNCLKYGVIYYVTVPSMYMLLVIYSIFNMNDVSWGTREVTVVPKPKVEDEDEEDIKEKEKKEAEKKPELKVLSFFGGNKDHNSGSLEFSCASLFKCMWCTHEKGGRAEEQLRQIQESIGGLGRKLEQLERYQLTGEILVEPRKTVNSTRTTIVEGSKAYRNSQYGKDRRISSIKSDSFIEDDDFNDEPLAPSPDVKANSWFYDGNLDKSPVHYLPPVETKFWNGLLDRYLHPIDDSDKKEIVAKGLKDLRDKMVITFFMVNSLFVLVVFLLTLEKDTLHLNWPIDAKVNFSYVENKNEFELTKTYLQLEPIGFVFLIFFALLLVVQFAAMLVHRFGTFAQIIANTKLDYFGLTKTVTLEEMYEQDPVKLVKKYLQNQKAANGEEDRGNTKVERRKTVHELAENKRRRTTLAPQFVDLEENFIKSYNNEDIKIDSEDQEGLRRKTLQVIKRKLPRSNSGIFRKSTNRVTFDNQAFIGDED